MTTHKEAVLLALIADTEGMHRQELQAQGNLSFCAAVEMDYADILFGECCNLGTRLRFVVDYAEVQIYVGNSGETHWVCSISEGAPR